jgi:lipoprotein NlpD
VAASSASLTWQWPATGSLIGRFATGRATSNKGIDIAGEAGDPVRAAAAGSVVYSGSGLLGYGQLVIIKHNDQFLSAYAHNRRLLVKEGDQIKAGEKIAEMGSSGAEKVKLHFEIRRSGKPVNPETYLPKR